MSMHRFDLFIVTLGAGLILGGIAVFLVILLTGHLA